MIWGIKFLKIEVWNNLVSLSIYKSIIIYSKPLDALKCPILVQHYQKVFKCFRNYPKRPKIGSELSIISEIVRQYILFLISDTPYCFVYILASRSHTEVVLHIECSYGCPLSNRICP